ncbi:MAG: tRNA uridine-5-carboxymethylaminomethyl(34) synthesis GTPase MnmE [Candidatus Marinimicrobia bacterium]|nr:tRNA uridine-5-carboxymethylaminomethyl(34) synthesis GTPase MnmE [Candidatus Neomarinimicrobiota bacterium]
MFSKNNSTIVALSTPQGFGGLSVVRLSGSNSLDIIKKIFASSREIKHCRATFGQIYDLEDNSHLDSSVVTYFKAPHSYTGEDIIEISCHGSPYITEHIAALCIKSGARLADPGEFTKRAFLNGKIDLIQAEGTADLIFSLTKASHKASINLLEGKTGQAIKYCRKTLIDTIALLELELDFSEEEIEFTPVSKIISTLSGLTEEISRLVQSYNYGKMVKQGLLVPIVGPPNSGKSSLLNAFLQEERVIVSPHPGTTRDTIEESFQKGGFQFRLIDTAGLRKTDDSIEGLGISRTLDNIDNADIILFVIDVTRPVIEFLPYFPKNANNTIIVINKIDIASEKQINAMTTYFQKQDMVMTSAKKHYGIHEIADIMVLTAKSKAPKAENVIITRKRHRDALSKALNSIIESLDNAKNEHSSEIVVVDLRIALEALDEILGKTTNEDILNTIFSNFCIGK